MFFRGYVETKDKQCVEKFKGRTDFKTYEQVKSLPEFAGILAEDTILVDLDDGESSDVLFKVVQDYSLNCRVYRTTRGKHFLFKNSGVGGCKTHCTLAIGLKADIKVGVKSSYEVLKYGGVEREILYDTAENEQAQPLPRWLFPVRSKMAYVPFLSAYEKAMGENEYYESVIKLIALLETKEIRAKRLNGQIWYEIDNIQDLNIAESLFAENESEHYRKITSRYGGYWRYPKLLDFCYLVNPYYPPEKMKEEIKSNFETLLTEYPSGMQVNSLLAAGAFGIEQKHIIVGNGAAELIKSLMDKIQLEGDEKIGCIYPTFEEYPNRYDKAQIVPYIVQTEDFRYTASDLMDFYADKEIRTLVLINPDNPSGNYIPYDHLLKLIDWCKEQNIRLIIDESFVDFADEKSLDDITLLNENVLKRYQELYVIKSISKSYGVPGARLGILASGNEEMISYLKKDVSIWNINSFGEFFLQIKEKYDKDYVKALQKIKTERKRFAEELEKILFFTVYPSQANYLMCRLKKGNSHDLCCALLKKNILVKDLTEKIKNGNQYIRIAVRNREDNDILVRALQEYEGV